MPFHHILAAIAVAALWGGNFVSAKIGMQYLPPVAFTGVRFLLTAGLLLPLIALRIAPPPSRRQWRFCAELALTLGTLHFSLMFAGLYMGLDIASSTVVAQLGAPFACLFGALILGDRLGPWRLFGMLVAFGGVVIVAGTPDALAHPAGFAATFFGAVAFGVASVRMKQMGEMHIFAFLGVMAAFAAPMLFTLSALVERPDFGAALALPAGLIGSLAFTVIGSTLAGHGMWYWLLRTYPVSQVAPYLLLTPLFGIASGHLFYQEPLTPGLIAGALTTVLGVAIITARRPRLLQFGEE